MLTKAPKVVMLTTSPSYSLPSSGWGGNAIRLIFSTAACRAGPSADATRTIPLPSVSSISMETPVSSSSSLTILPFGPITSPILSLGISMASIRGVHSLSSERGSEITLFISSRMKRRTSRAWDSAWLSTSVGSPAILVSNWRAVIISAVPATLKSMSPMKSSSPMMSVRVTYSPSWWISPMAIPATGARMGTPASIRDRVEEQTAAMEVDPLDERTSETSRSA